MLANIKVAIIHDWLVSYAGAERVLEQLLRCFPQADIYTLVDFLPEQDRAFLKGHHITTSFIQRLPFSRKYYRQYLPFMPLAVEQFDLSSYQLVISSSHAVAKGVITGPDQQHISYVHSPIRYAWDLQHQYLKESGLDVGVKSIVVRYLLHKMRMWDVRTANGVDVFIANSQFIAKRIWKVYRRESHVIYPPVYVESFPICVEKDNFYLTASRMVPYKKIDIIVEAFKQMPDKVLFVIGDGPDMVKINDLAQGCNNVQILGYQPMHVLREYMQKAKAFVFAAEEDFGITPVEAQACGTPVIAYGKGGALETVSDGKTGLFFGEQSVVSIMEAISRFEANTWSFQSCREQAEKFATANFHDQIQSLIMKELNID